MLLGGRMALVVEVVQQRSGGVKLQQRAAFLRRLGSSQTQPVGLSLAERGYAGLHGKGMFAQALALCPFSQQLPCLLAPIHSVTASAHLFSPHGLLASSVILRFDPKFPLDNYGSFARQ